MGEFYQQQATSPVTSRENQAYTAITGATGDTLVEANNFYSTGFTHRLILIQGQGATWKKLNCRLKRYKEFDTMINVEIQISNSNNAEYHLQHIFVKVQVYM